MSLFMRRFERQAARRYWHMSGPYRRCGVGFCSRCWWRTLTGGHRRARAEFLARSRAAGSSKLAGEVEA